MSSVSIPEAGENGVSSWLDKLKGACEFHQEALALAEEAKRDMHQFVYELGQVTPIGVRDEIVNELYWQYPEVSPMAIAEWFGYGKKRIPAGVVQPLYLEEFACTACGIPFEITSRNKLAEIKRDLRKAQRQRFWNDGLASLCRGCREAHLEQTHAESNARREARNRRLAQLKAMPYREYLATPEWQAQRQRTLRNAGYSCQVCNAANTMLDVHHRTYERRGNEYYKDLIVLCRDCHTTFHYKVGVSE